MSDELRRYEVCPVEGNQLGFANSIHRGDDEKEAIRALIFHLRDHNEGVTLGLVDWNGGNCQVFRRKGQQLLRILRS